MGPMNIGELEGLHPDEIKEIIFAPRRFRLRVARPDLDLAKPCREWKGATFKSGYGKVSIDGDLYKVHRLSAYCCLKLPNEREVFVEHRCDNRRCYEPTHLRLGDAASNNRDKADKGRAPRLLGEANKASKLTAKKVRKIRLRRVQGEPVAEIAERYGISKRQVRSICNGTAWSHVK